MHEMNRFYIVKTENPTGHGAAVVGYVGKAKIAIGDILRAYGSGTPTDWKVCNISLYQHSVQEVDSGMSARLVLECTNPDVDATAALKPMEYLVG
jgi:hypothetical protein